MHMNSTKWLSLTEFVKYLGRTGQCKVDETPKGWFVQLIEKDPFKDIEESKKRKREEAERDDDTRQMREIEKQASLCMDTFCLMKNLANILSCAEDVNGEDARSL